MSTKIISAVWAGPFAGFDVTETVQNRVNNNEFNIPASDTVFGDPDGGQQKVLTVIYTQNGSGKLYRGCREGLTLNLE